jgi:DME family drug/metabolite transporter/O-acetylserine/cysteine efflux transporter
MTTRDKLLAVFVTAIWGLNFLAVRIGLDHYPPFFFAAIRYLVMVLPVVLFVPRPKVATRWLVGYGLGFGTMQFGFLFLAIRNGMPTGLSSLVLQASAPFTVLLGVLLLHERLTPRQIAGIVLAVLGLGIIAWDRAESAALLPVVLTLLGAFGWALGNLSGRQAKNANPLHFALWMSVIPPIPLLALSAVLEGPTTGWRDLGRSFSADGWPGLAATVFIVLMGGVLGSTIWTALLSRNPAAIVAPFSLLEPVVGIAGAWMFLNERPGLLALVGSIIGISGVLVGLPPRPATGRMPAKQAERQAQEV